MVTSTSSHRRWRPVSRSSRQKRLSSLRGSEKCQIPECPALWSASLLSRSPHHPSPSSALEKYRVLKHMRLFSNRHDTQHGMYAWCPKLLSALGACWQLAVRGALEGGVGHGTQDVEAVAQTSLVRPPLQMAGHPTGRGGQTRIEIMVSHIPKKSKR